MRRTKIVCTIGPASETTDILKSMMLAGMNVARMNFSHGNHEDHGRRIALVRKAAEEVGKNIAIMLDTKGPEIRLGVFKEEPILLRAGDEFTLTTEEIEGDNSKVSVTYRELPQDVGIGDKILVADGLIELNVLEKTDTEVRCQVVNGGELKSRKGVNLPGIKVNLPSLTDKDISDIVFGIEQQVDYIAASFIRKAADVLAIRDILEQYNADIHIISKIESREAVDNIDAILKVSDGIMVARGDLGVEIPAEDVPMIQKMLIKKCNKAGKPVVTATQMLESMTHNPRPTRAEASDVANAILDGTDAIMLSGESAAGRYPVEAVQTMNRIALRVESAFPYTDYLKRYGDDYQSRTVTDGISSAVCTISSDLEASAILTATASGHTAKMISKYRPKAPIIAVTPNPKVLLKMSLVWGVEPLLINDIKGTDEMISATVEVALAAGYINAGDLVVITAGVPVGIHGTTNLLKVHTVGRILAKGTGIGQKAVTGKVKICRSTQDAEQKITDGDVMVAIGTDREFVPYMEKCSAIITEEAGLTSHAAIVGINIGIPVIVGVENATRIIPDEEIITVDGQRGLIYSGSARVL